MATQEEYDVLKHLAKAELYNLLIGEALHKSHLLLYNVHDLHEIRSLKKL